MGENGWPSAEGLLLGHVIVLFSISRLVVILLMILMVILTVILVV